MQPGIWQIIIIAVIVLLLFGGRGKLSGLMGDAAKGIKAFKKGMQDDEPAAQTPPKTIDQNPPVVRRTDDQKVG